MILKHELTEGLIYHLRDFIHREETCEQYKVAPQDFTRHRKLSFDRVVVLLLQGTKMPLQQRLNRFFKALGEGSTTPTASALCQARQKVQPEIFEAMSLEAIDYFYQEYPKHGSIKTWQDHRLLAVDASYFNVQDTEETRDIFSIQRNQTDKERVQALTSYLYDVLNETILNAEIGAIQGEKYFVFGGHIAHWQPGDIVIYDRGYVDYSLLAYHVLVGIPIVVRCPLTSSFKVIKEFVASDLTDVQVTLRVTRRQSDFVTTYGLPTEIQVRLVKIILPNGDTEVLLTTLLDQVRYSVPSLKWMYKQRWGEETCIGRLKNLLDIERFSSKKVTGLLQDFFALVFVANLESLLSQIDDLAIQERSQEQGHKHVYKVNKSVAYHTIIMYLGELLVQTQQPINEILAEVRHMLRLASVPIRPGRSFERKKLSPRRKERFLRYNKRVWC